MSLLGAMAGVVRRRDAEAPPWDPLTPALQPAWWLRADSLVTLDGADITDWDNLGTAGAALDLSFDSGKEAAEGATLGGQATVGFDATAWGLTSSTAILDVDDDEDLLVILVWRPTWASGRNQILGADSWDPGSFGAGFGYQPRIGGAARWGVADGSGGLLDNGSAQATNSVYVDALVLEGAASPSDDTATLVQDGVGSGTTADLGSIATGGSVYTVGKGPAGSGSATLELAEMLVYVGSGVASSWRSTVESDFIAYLLSRYGLTRANVA